LGAFAAVTGLITLASVETAICKRFPGSPGEMNAAAAREAYHFVAGRLRAEWGASHHARAN